MNNKDLNIGIVAVKGVGSMDVAGLNVESQLKEKGEERFLAL